MRYKLLVLFICLSLCGAAAADTVQAIINGKVCSLCGTGIEKTFRAQPEVKSVDVDLENKLVTIHTMRSRVAVFLDKRNQRHSSLVRRGKIWTVAPRQSSFDFQLE